MKIYHGTNANLLSEILQNGLPPRDATGDQGHWPITAVIGREDGDQMSWRVDIFGGSNRIGSGKISE